MLRAAINATEDKRLNSDLPKAKDDINWPLGKANTVAEQRNNAVHGPMGLSLGSKEIELRPLWHYGNPRALKLVGKGILTEFAWYEEYADTLTRFAREMRALR